MSIKVLVTGSRSLAAYQPVYDALEAIRAQGVPMIVIHGDARGADHIAKTWATYMPDVTVVSVPADWKNDGPRAAGPIRNSRMLELGPDIVLAFFQEELPNKGTQHMAKIAREAGIPVEVTIVPQLVVD